MNHTKITRDNLLKKIFSFEEDSYASVLVGIILQDFGTDAFEWDPETLRMEIEEKYGLKSLHHVPENRLQAGIMSLTSNMWTQDVYQFNLVCNAFGDGEVPHQVYEPCGPDEIAWTLVEYSLMNPPARGETPIDQQFSEPVRTYMAKILEHHGIRPMGFFTFLSDKYDIPISDESDIILANAGFEETERQYKNVKDYVEENLAKLSRQVSALGVESQTLRFPDLSD